VKKHRIARLAALLLIPLAALAFAADEAPDEEKPVNLATNPGFEQWHKTRRKHPLRTPDLEDDQVPVDWEASMVVGKDEKRPKGAVYKDTEVKHEGDASVRIENGDKKTSTSIVRWDLPAKPETTYRITVWFKGKGIAYGKGGQAMVWFSAGPKKGYWGDRKGTYKALKKAGDYDWTPVTCQFTTRDVDELFYVNINFRWGTGTLWVDDVELIEVEKKAAGE
jgi:hypothetical protein